MATYTRANAWNKGGTFDNPDLLWYARGIGAMQARAISDPASWWFFAAIHGQYLQNLTVPVYLATGWGTIPAPPTVPIGGQLRPPSSTQFWDQCQHQTWFFAPWHRGYLLALEAQIRADVTRLGGPSTWALPYWDYFGDGEQYNIPPAFTQQTLPGGGPNPVPNPLFVTARYGPDSTGTDIYVPTPEAIEKHPDPPFGPVTQDCMLDTIFAGDQTTPEFGGPDTTALGCFWHGGGKSGDLENNPHNLVHVYVGGPNTQGLMGDPGLAALDPIFYLHHANIDRMWAGWNQVLGNANPTEGNWLNGPGACGDAVFAMPMPGPSTWVYTPQDVNSLSQLNYEYESYDSLPKPKPAPVQLSERLTKLGAEAFAQRVNAGAALNVRKKVELVGASKESMPVQGSGVRTTVTLDPAARSKVAASLAAPSETAPPDRVFLNLENVRGTQNASVLSVFINLPLGADPKDHPELLAGSVGLFGLRQSSQPDESHGGQGLSFSLEITRIVDALHLSDGLKQDSLQVTVVPSLPLPEQATITIGRISIYRKGN